VSFIKKHDASREIAPFAPKFSKLDFKLTDFGRDETMASTRAPLGWFVFLPDIYVTSAIS